MNNYKELANCLACGATDLRSYCDLGHQPLANNLKNTVDEPDELYPLAVAVCNNCYHSQLTVAVDRDLLYKHYLYVSGTTRTLVEEFDRVAELIHTAMPGPNRNVLDIACNDGTFLRAFRKYQWNLYGVDPAENIVSQIQDEDLHVTADYFPLTGEDSLPQFDVITCFNVVAHVADPLSLLKECARKLKSSGTVYIQTSQREMIKNGEFDTIYHEHHSFFNINSMRHMAARAGLCLDDVQTRPVHGKSYLFVLKHQSSNDAHIDQLIAEEAFTLNPQTYVEFGEKVQKNKTRLLNIISQSTNPVIGYGAAAKGVVMSNYLGTTLKYIVDENPLKINRVIGGVNVPIAHPDRLAAEPNDLTIVVYAWNFIDEITAKIKKLRPTHNDIILPSMIK